MSDWSWLSRAVLPVVVVGARLVRLEGCAATYSTQERRDRHREAVRRSRGVRRALTPCGGKP